jgi:phytoene dehydrogenase-like protein
MLDAVVVGSGPNGLAAALVLARAGRSVTVLERAPTPGGGARSVEATLPGVIHDHCASVPALGYAGPFLPTVPGVELLHPEFAAAHPLPDQPAVLLHRDLDATAIGLEEDTDYYRSTVGALVERWDVASELVLGTTSRVPGKPAIAARLGRHLARSAASIIDHSGPRLGALMAGMAAHGGLPLDGIGTAGIGSALLAAAHIADWPFVAGGMGRLVDAMVDELASLGGGVECHRPVRSRQDLPAARAVFLDTSPGAAATILGLTGRRASSLRSVRHGPGVWKVDWLLAGPIPWADPAVAGAGTVHLGGTADRIAAALEAVAADDHPANPFVLLTQPSIVDGSRAPDGQHVIWAYCHVPNGSEVHMTGRIERQIERFAPGFRDLVVARTTTSPAEFEADNPNLVGGDIANGAPTLMQILARPRLSLTPWRLARGAYLCSAATPPGPGIHGMSGVHAANVALSNELA